MNELKVVKGKADGCDSQTSAGGQNSWAQDALGTNLSSQAPGLTVASVQASGLGCRGAGASRGEREFQGSPGQQAAPPPPPKEEGPIF